MLPLHRFLFFVSFSVLTACPNCIIMTNTVDTDMLLHRENNYVD